MATHAGGAVLSQHDGAHCAGDGAWFGEWRVTGVHGERAGHDVLCVVEAFHGPEGAARQMPVDAARITQLFLYGVATRV